MRRRNSHATILHYSILERGDWLEFHVSKVAAEAAEGMSMSARIHKDH